MREQHSLVAIRHQRRWERSRLVCSVVLGIVLGAWHGAIPAAADEANTDWAGAVLVTVQLIDDRFVPDKLVFRRGVAYRLHMENSGDDIIE